ncbi:helix-turn-helix domain-containing protein [Tissierella praeacuta]|uniref:helix-turn-helix domain-containing protein n=1 Tax=Tissierella praeacuta TaxID=43131 RepID=UPI003DA3923E
MAIIYDPLWKTLANRNMNKEDLKKLTNLSPSTVAKMSRNEYVALRVIDDICQALQVSTITEVMEFVGGTGVVKRLDNIETLINKLMSNKINKIKTDDKDLFLLYLTMEEFIDSQMDNETNDNKDKFISLYSKCFTEKLLPDDLLDELNKMIKKYLL